jgi:hypothetical protein
MIEPRKSQKEQVIGLLAERGMARLTELKAAGVTAAAVSRLERDGAILRLNRGIYGRALAYTYRSRKCEPIHETLLTSRVRPVARMDDTP